jgi:hypothetical protein
MDSTRKGSVMNRKWSERSARWTKRRLVTLVVVFVLVGGMVLLSRMLDSGTGPTVTEPMAASETTMAERPEVDDTDRQTIETSLGTWVWSRVDTLSDQVDEADTPLPSSTLPEVPLPQIDGMTEWLIRTGEDAFPHLFPQSTSFGDVTITVVPVEGRVDWGRLVLSDDGWVEGANAWVEGTYWQAMGCPEEPASVCPEQNPVLEIRYSANRRVNSLLVEATVVSGDLEAVEFRDLDIGELVVRLEATDPEVSAELLMRAAAWGLWSGAVVWKLHVDDGEAGWVDPPWLGIPLDELVVAVGGEGFVGVGIEHHYFSPGRGPGGTAPTLHTWGSRDGVTWEELVPVQTVEVPLGWQDIRLLVHRDLLVLAFDDGGPHIPRWVWTSTSGSGWQQAQLDVRGVEKSFDALTRTSSGWVLLIHGQTGVPGPKGARCEVWVSANGVNWEQISSPPDSRKANSARCFIDGGTVGLITEHVTSVVPRESYDTYWRGTFED